LRISERLRSALFRLGVPSLGLRAWPLAFLVCLALGGVFGAVVERIPAEQRLDLAPAQLTIPPPPSLGSARSTDPVTTPNTMQSRLEADTKNLELVSATTELAGLLLIGGMPSDLASNLAFSKDVRISAPFNFSWFAEALPSWVIVTPTASSKPDRVHQLSIGTAPLVSKMRPGVYRGGLSIRSPQDQGAPLVIPIILAIYDLPGKTLHVFGRVMYEDKPVPKASIDFSAMLDERLFNPVSVRLQSVIADESGHFDLDLPLVYPKPLGGYSVFIGGDPYFDGSLDVNDKMPMTITLHPRIP
jgi:hypothetical protein